jgi:uncharacterized membrane protein YqaE (UPF0057 family)
MRYIVALFVPPLAIAMCKRWGHFVFNLVFFLASFPMIFVLGSGILMWILCIVHALVICRMSSIDRRIDRIVGAIKSQSGSQATEI